MVGSPAGAIKRLTVNSITEAFMFVSRLPRPCQRIRRRPAPSLYRLPYRGSSSTDVLTNRNGRSTMLSQPVGDEVRP